MSNLLPAADLADNFVIAHISSGQSELSMLQITASFDSSSEHPRLWKATLCRLRVQKWGAQQSVEVTLREILSRLHANHWYDSTKRLP